MGDEISDVVYDNPFETPENDGNNSYRNLPVEKLSDCAFGTWFEIGSTISYLLGIIPVVNMIPPVAVRIGLEHYLGYDVGPVAYAAYFAGLVIFPFFTASIDATYVKSRHLLGLSRPEE